MNKHNRPRTIVVETRCDIRSLATLYTFFKNNNIRVDSHSSLVREVIETMKDIVVSNGAEDVTDTSIALSVLSREGLSPNEKNRKSLFKQIKKENFKSFSMSDTSISDGIIDSIEE